MARVLQRRGSGAGVGSGVGSGVGTGIGSVVGLGADSLDMVN